MLTIQNKILRSIITTMLITALILSGLFSFPAVSNAAPATKTVTITDHKDINDLAYYDIWKHEDGTWQNGKKQGSSVSQSYAITESLVPEGATIISVSGEFDTRFDKDRYNDFCVLSADISDIDYEYAAGTVKQSDTAEIGYIVSTILTSRSGTNGKNIKEDWQAPDVEGWRYFIPAKFTITYTTTQEIPVEPGDFELTLDVPASVKKDDEITVATSSVVDAKDGMKNLTLERRIDGGTWTLLDTWTGDGTLGVDIGGSINDTLTEVGKYDYRTTGTDINNKVKTLTKAVNVGDNREIIVNPNLVLPEYTYEGHIELAEDESTFEVDGKDYSAVRAYVEDIASNSFRCGSSTVHISKLSDTKANATFSNTGIYSIDLKIRTASGGSASDTESIEVRKTPYIIDSLSGFQKQNRKQILNITVATYPGKPLTDYTITLKDKKTSETVTLTPATPQANTTTIKTRAVTMTQDMEKGFAYITVEFLTKTPSYFSTGTNTQDFYYDIHVEDSKGDTDTASKTFAVSPDLPPVPAISIDPAFLRNEGTNIASIKSEDVTVAVDGDSVARTWYYGATTAPASFTDVSTMAGYKKLSFGTDKIVGFDRTGVGRFTTKLFVKEVWTEPTLEEYVTDADRLTGTATAFSDVLNVAPVVSLELSKAKEKEVFLLANNDAEYQALLNNKTVMQMELLKNKIDARIIIGKLLGSTPSDVTGITTKLDLTFPAPLWNGSSMTIESPYYQIVNDSEKTYISVWNWATGSPTIPITLHAINPYSGTVWSYTTTRNEYFTLGQDDLDMYLYLIYKDTNQTVLIDKRTGAVAGTINITLPEKVILTDDLFIFYENNKLYAINQNTLSKFEIEANVYAVSRVGGDVQYLTSSDKGIVKNMLNINSFEVTRRMLTNPSDGSIISSNYIPVCIDATGKSVLYRPSIGKNYPIEIKVFSPNNELIKEISLNASMNNNDMYSIAEMFCPISEDGSINHIIMWEKYKTINTFSGINLNTGKTSKVQHNTGEPFNFQTCFESKGISYLYDSGWYLTAGFGYCGPGSAIMFNGNSISQVPLTSVGGKSVYDEVIVSSDRILTTFFGENNVPISRVKISAMPKTLAQETSKFISTFTNKSTLIGDINTTAEQIKTSVESPPTVLKIDAKNNGSITLPSFALPANKYYYEYEIKPLNPATKDGLSGIRSTEETVKSPQNFLNDTLYVEKSYEKSISNIGSTTITVPTGKCAIITFDVKGYTPYPSEAIRTIEIYVNNELCHIQLPTSADSKEFTASFPYQKILYEGTHTIETRATKHFPNYYDWANTIIKIDLLKSTPQDVTSTFDIRSGKEKKWETISGSFVIPNKTISYGAQAATHYYGPLSSAVTSYHPTGNPKTIEYYQTVPAGHLQTGRVLLTSNRLSTNVTYTIKEVGAIRKTTGDKVNQWVAIPVLSAGTHTHSIRIDARRDDTAAMDVFDIITYPDNEVTRTGNISFNSSGTRLYFPKETFNGRANLSMYLPKGEYLLKKLKIYYIENGQKIYVQNKSLDDLTDLSPWVLPSGMTASMVDEFSGEKPDDEFVKIYKKGEKVLYDIFYDDYEDDPSKIGYWQYSHINWPPDPIHPDVGKVLTAPIDRFYLSGKYTVTHWEVDNTQRTGTVGDATPYNKESNKVDLTFYVDGTGKAPWITYIKTDPPTVKENNSYTLAVGVDDTEKDVLTLETEVYLNGKSILTDTKTNITAGERGEYPEQTISGLPAAHVGVYQVVCTVSDYGGTGIKSYKFTVVSEGKITGSVNHTDKWNVNRQKYNLAKSGTTDSPRGYNVFWSGERFVLHSEVAGSPTSVTAQILGYSYATTMHSTGVKNAANETIYAGEIWDKSMINKWGKEAPVTLTFRFIAYYSGGITKTHDVDVIVDNRDAYYKLHRYF